MKIWKRPATVADINALCKGNMCEHVGIVITALGDDYITGTMPVDARTQQHMGIIHGGASVVLAETLGSIGAGLCCPDDSYTVGLDINANHIRAGKPPYVTGTARALHVGSSTMVWEIRITDTDDKLVCISRLTCAVLKRNK
ncbi:MAG TPA: hotdog fold thioesterase [Candidatus Acidoferrum sp.]|nr:hotdog fold thioesterase [Candidatus Acidoferrum sp.]